MRKQLLFLAFLCTVITSLKANDYAFAKAEKPKTNPTSIEKVTVYLSGAQIERSAKVSVTPGTNTILFDNLSNDINENSIQIAGLGDASIVSINFGINYLTEQLNSTKVDSLQQVKNSIETQLLQLENTKSGLHKEEEVISANQNLGSNVTEIDLEKIKALSNYYRTRITAIHNEILDIDIKKTTLQRQVNDIKRQFNELNVTQEKSKGQITLKLNTDKAAQLDLIIKYNVNEAGWYPEYDLKALAIDTPLALSYKAHLYQKTGISWEDVNLVLSTGDPNTNNLKPTLDTKYLNFVSNSYRNTSTPTKAYTYKYNPTIRTISGIVTENGSPLLGAYVIVKGTSNGVQTDFNGAYTIEVNEGEKLVFSYVGFSTKEVPIHASTMNVSLEADNALEEVVVTARGVKREKRALGYAVSDELQGRAAGVQVNSGNSNIIKIRGVGSFTEGSEPLFVVDGIPLSAYAAKNINSKDIVDVEVLKDANSTAIYGNRGSNGVVIITTKGAQTATGDIKTEGLTNTNFEIQKKYTIVSDGDITIIEIDKFDVPATYQYYVAPGVNENVFLTASIKDWVRYSLLPGEANVYFEGSFSGKTYINPLETTEELSVSLGIDPNITVKRKQLDNFKSKSFIGTQRIIDMAYAVTIKNNKNKAITLKIEDRIPISQNKEIKVDEIETYDAVYDKETGMMHWEVTLTPGNAIKKEFGYTLKYPKYKKINL